MSWHAVLYRDGEPATGLVPAHPEDVASIVAPLIAGWLGGPVSVGAVLVELSQRQLSFEVVS